MKQQVYQTPLAGGVATKLPQNPQDAGRAENLAIDPATGGWSTRVGYEPFVQTPTDWNPFGSTGPVYALHCSQAIAGGARQHILFEADGKLQLLFEADGNDNIVELATGRHVPTPTDAAAWFTDTGYGTIVTNGVDRPVLVRPWPLPNVNDARAGSDQVIRPFGFDGLPAPWNRAWCDRWRPPAAAASQRRRPAVTALLPYGALPTGRLSPTADAGVWGFRRTLPVASGRRRSSGGRFRLSPTRAAKGRLRP